MNLFKFSVGAALVSMTTWVHAIAVADPDVGLPLEDGGLFALAAACLAVGIRIARKKRNH